MPTKLKIAGFEIRKTTERAALRFLHGKLRKRQPMTVFYVNANFAIQCSHLRREISQSSDIILLNDGVALEVAAMLRCGSRFPDNLNGTDFTPAFLATLERKSRVFLLGGRPGIALTAAEKFRQYPQAEICGTLDGYSIWDDEAEVIRTINDAKPDVLLVAMGNPRQEEWILRNRGSLEVPLIFAVGALFDFVSGTMPRAPMILRRFRLEWAYRLLREPNRLVGRYTIGILRFFGIALFYRNET